MRVVEIKVYTIDEHPFKDRCFEWVRNNIQGLNQHSVTELIERVEALSNVIGGTFDHNIYETSYVIGSQPMGEYITFDDYCEYTLDTLTLGTNKWDDDLIEGLEKKDGGLQALRSLHKETEHQYSDSMIMKYCMDNGYEFYEDGKLYLNYE